MTVIFVIMAERKLLLHETSFYSYILTPHYNVITAPTKFHIKIKSL